MKYQRITDDVRLGKNVKIYDFVNLYGCEISDNSQIAAFVEIQKDVKIGKNCKISSHTFICSGVTIEDNVFVGHNVCFVNDKYPRATDEEGNPLRQEEWQVEPILVKTRASIGSGSVILSNLTIGENSIIGAGSVVTKDVPDGVIVAGNPAKVLRAILNFEF